MNNLDDLLTFLFEFKNDDRVVIYKRMKYGFRYYHIDFQIDKKEDQKTYYDDYMRITIDTRNDCVDLSSGIEDNGLLIEDKDLVKKWDDILESHLLTNLDERIVSMFETTFKSCNRKDIYREYQMKKMGFIEDDDDEEEGEEEDVKKLI